MHDEEPHEKLLSLANRLQEFAEFHPDQAPHIEPILEHIGMELKEHSPLSAKCTNLLFDENGNRNAPPCGNFRGMLSFSMCDAWRMLETGEKTKMGDAMRDARAKAFSQCGTEKPTEVKAESAQ